MIFHDQQCNFHDYLMQGIQPPLLAAELILGFVEKGPTSSCFKKGANLQIKWVMVFF